MTLTVGDVSEKVFERLVLAGDLDGRHAHREARARPLLVLVDEAKQPRDGARDDAQVLRALVHADHCVRLACGPTKRGELHVSSLIAQKNIKILFMLMDPSQDCSFIVELLRKSTTSAGFLVYVL